MPPKSYNELRHSNSGIFEGRGELESRRSYSISIEFLYLYRFFVNQFRSTGPRVASAFRSTTKSRFQYFYTLKTS
jgi:hypothetical protein